jgi:subtilisin family serine protease
MVVWLAVAAMAVGLPVQAKAPGGARGDLQRYIVELHDLPLALSDARRQSFPGDSPLRLELPAGAADVERKLDFNTVAAREYLSLLESRQGDFLGAAVRRLGRELPAVYSYRLATNGLALDLTEAEAAALRDSPSVRSILPDQRHRLQSYAGPIWIGADDLWDGAAGFMAARGEGVVVGIIDSGINWDSPSFIDPSLDGYSHVNPYGQQLGLCADPEVLCNNKLVGVYDFVEDDPSTDDVVEENTNGRDNDGHGSHVASIAAGNRVNTFFDGEQRTLHGVAPRANIVSYRVCYVGEPETEDSGGCMGSAILAAIEQAVADGVDVLNYSIGSDAGNPWSIGSISRAFLAARNAGIFVATSAGNGGPNPGTVTSPANAPWIMAVGAATHDQNPYTRAGAVEDLSGGDVPASGEFLGVTRTGGLGVRPIVHARDFGNALCGVGEPELQPDCEGNQGLSNPWDGQTPFNGEIVVCDRGIYGRVEKGKNVLLAGAGGYILANTDEWGEYKIPEEHCLPATHLGVQEGDALRAWLDSGSGHQGSLSGESTRESALFADRILSFSSRGPAAPPVEDVQKPNVIAPGLQILGAAENGQEYAPLSGTSFSSPHLAGAAALLKSLHNGWTVSQLSSSLETTATPEQVTDGGFAVSGSSGSNFLPATPLEYGAGRPQLGEAANAGLYLPVTGAEFTAANPSAGGDPKDLNLAGLVDSRCRGACSFVRTVADQMGGGNWTATPIGFPPGVLVATSPSNFSLANGGSRSLTVGVNLESTGVIGDWVHGLIRFSAAGSADQHLTVSAFSYGGDLPDAWIIEDGRDSGWQAFQLSGLAAMPDATFRSGGLDPADRTVRVLPEDETHDDPYDGGAGVFTKWHLLPQGGLWLHAETLISTAEDLDLYVGVDLNGNGSAEESEELCSSTSPDDIEQCDLYNLQPGNYWILVQNWTGTEPDGDEVTLLSAAVTADPDATLAASGPGIVQEGAAFDLRLSWENVAAVPGETWFGAVGVGTQRESPNNIGVIPVRFVRDGVSAPTTFPLFDGREHRLALEPGGSHDLLFIDIPPGASSLTVGADGASAEQSDSLTLELRRLDFDQGLINPPFATAPDAAESIIAGSGGGGNGPTLAVTGGALQAGRYYAVLGNEGAAAASVRIRVDVGFAGAALPVHRGLWEPNSRPGLGQGFDYNWGGTDRALIWYTYDEQGQATWYIAGSPSVQGNIWVSDLYRVTNDGAEQQLARVGHVAVTILGEDDALFTFTLFGESGTDRMQPLSALTCPNIEGSPRSYTGIWFRGSDGLGGASVIVNSATQAQIHYLFDALGVPRWLFAQDLEQPAPTNPTLPFLQFSGYCAVCSATSVSKGEAGVLSRTFNSQTNGSWTLDYQLQPPLTGAVERTEAIVKLTGTLDCL